MRRRSLRTRRGDCYAGDTVAPHTDWLTKCQYVAIHEDTGPVTGRRRSHVIPDLWPERTSRDQQVCYGMQPGRLLLVDLLQSSTKTFS